VPRVSALTALTTLTAATAVVLLGAGCSSGGSDHHTPSPSPSTARTSARPSPTVVQNKDIPTSGVLNKPALRKSVVITGCARTAKGWRASGTAAAPHSRSHTYKITIFFATSGGTVEDFAETEVDVAAGRTATWHAAKTFPALAGTRCILRGVG
jgi:hypothetical protein